MGQGGLPTLLTAAQVGRRLGIPAAEVARLAGEGRLAAHRLGEGDRGLRFLPDDVMAYLESVRTGPAPARVEQEQEDEDEDDSVMADGLEDIYHWLLIGPCTPEMLEAEADCPLIRPILVTRSDASLCSYEDWRGLFRDKVRRAASNGGDILDGEFRPPGEEELVAATAGSLPSGTILLKCGGKIVAAGGRWAAVRSGGDHLEELEDPQWYPPGEPFGLTFATPFEAYAALRRAEAIDSKRSDRFDEAMKVLGIELD